MTVHYEAICFLDTANAKYFTVYLCVVVDQKANISACSVCQFWHILCKYFGSINTILSKTSLISIEEIFNLLVYFVVEKG